MQYPITWCNVTQMLLVWKLVPLTVTLLSRIPWACRQQILRCFSPSRAPASHVSLAVFKSELTVPGRYWPWIMKPLWGFVARAPEFVSAQRLAILASARFGPRSVDACETAVGLHYCAGSAGHARLLVEAWRRDACLEDVGHVSYKCYVVRGPRQTASQFSARMALSVKSQSVTSARSQSSYTSEQARRHFGRRRQAYLVLAGAISVVGQTSQILCPNDLKLSCCIIMSTTMFTCP